jgi:hypothetical protein
MMPDGSRNVAAERGNIVGIAAMSILWITPTLQFWGAVFGPFRPYGYPAEDVAPSLVGFVLGLAACFVPRLLPATYYRCWEGRRGPRVYGAVGVRAFKRLVPNGDLVNRWARRLDPRYRVIRDQASAVAWLDRTRDSERSHLVLLVAGLLTAAYAARIGWNGWAVGLTASNVVFNLYPVFLQRYTRCRIAKLLRHRVQESPGAR